MRAVFELTINTPLSIGWYDPDVVDTRFFIRPTSVKGVWRWWARAVVGGVLYEAGCVKGLEAETARIVANELGLGSTGAASAYRIQVRVLRAPNIRKLQKRVRRGIQRLDLLALSREVEYAEGGRFELVVEAQRPVDREKFRAAAAVLALALTLQGLGKGGRKALGVVDVLNVRDHGPRGGVRELMETARSGVKTQRCGAEPEALPPFPVAAKNFFEVYTVSAGFPEIHNIFLRPQRARLAYGNFAGPDPMDHDAWFLGLPRSQKGTGYMPKDKEAGRSAVKEARRASAVFAAAHSKSHIYGGLSYVSIFLSGDWPQQIQWVGGSGRKDIRIDDARIRGARSRFLQLIQRWNPSRVWP